MKLQQKHYEQMKIQLNEIYNEVKNDVIEKQKTFKDNCVKAVLVVIFTLLAVRFGPGAAENGVKRSDSAKRIGHKM